MKKVQLIFHTLCNRNQFSEKQKVILEKQIIENAFKFGLAHILNTFGQRLTKDSIEKIRKSSQEINYFNSQEEALQFGQKLLREFFDENEVEDIMNTAFEKEYALICNKMLSEIKISDTERLELQGYVKKLIQ